MDRLAVERFLYVEAIQNTIANTFKISVEKVQVNYNARWSFGWSVLIG